MVKKRNLKKKWFRPSSLWYLLLVYSSTQKRLSLHSSIHPSILPAQELGVYNQSSVIVGVQFRKISCFVKCFSWQQIIESRPVALVKRHQRLIFNSNSRHQLRIRIPNGRKLLVLRVFEKKSLAKDNCSCSPRARVISSHHPSIIRRSITIIFIIISAIIHLISLHLHFVFK